MASKKRFSRPSNPGFSRIAPLLVSILLAILVPVLVVILLNELATPFFDNLSQLITTFTTVSTGSAIGDVILILFGTIILPIVAVVFFVTIAMDHIGKRQGGV